MTRINTILSITLVVQLGLGMVTRQKGESHRVQENQSVLPASMERENISDIEIWGSESTESSTPNIVLHKEGSDYVLSSHASYPVVESKVSAILSALTGAKARRPLTTSVERQIQLKVADDSYQRKLTIRTSGEPMTMFIGVAAGQGRTAIRVKGEDTIYAVQGLPASSFGDKPDFWVDPQYFKLDQQTIRSVSLSTTKGMFDLVRSDEDWTIRIDSVPLVFSEKKELKQSTIDSLLSSISNIRLKEPVAKEKTKTMPIVTVIIQSEKKEATEEDNTSTLEIFKEGEAYIVHETGNTAFVEVEKSTIAELLDLSKENLEQEKVEKKAEAIAPPMPQSPFGPMPMPGMSR